jgi:arylformamidase
LPPQRIRADVPPDVDERRLIDLTQPFDADAYHSAALPPPEFSTLSDVEDDGTNVQWYGAPTHVGTHIDAPRHFVPGGKTMEDLALDRFERSGVVLDVERPDPDRVTVADLEGAEGRVEAGDILLLRTSWGEKYATPAYERYPWLAETVGDWLLDRGISMLAVDTPSPDRPREMRPEDWDEYPIHRTLLPAEVLIAEHLRIPAGLSGARVEVRAFPLAFRGGDGAPVRFVVRPEQ